jgi:hypothetical protein
MKVKTNIVNELLQIKKTLEGIEEVLLVIAGLKTKDEYLKDN